MSNLPPGVTNRMLDEACGADCDDYYFMVRVSVWAPDRDTAREMVKDFEFEIESVEDAE